MGLSRRKIKLSDAHTWVFNRMAREYDERPPYPLDLLDALCTLAGASGARVVDVGAGIGHLSLPLAARRFVVTAVEPANPARFAAFRERVHALPEPVWAFGRAALCLFGKRA